MSSKQIEVADIFRAFADPYIERFGECILPSHRRAISDITGCMTEAMGGGRYYCNDCSEDFWSFHGCRNRSCPKCHGRQIVTWMNKREAEMLPCNYFHVVATVPGELRDLFLKHQKILYGILIKASAIALCELAKDKRYIGAEPGIMAVLHTWTAQMHLHPHVHMLVTGGGVNKDGKTWHEAANDFLVPVKKLSPMISQRFADTLKKEAPDLFDQIPGKVWKKEWCSFCKPFGRERDAVVRYLARYVFRIAITSNRIVSMDETHVTYKYKENNTGDWKMERLSGVEFIRRYLLHVLPKGLHKVRYYGLWSAPKRKLQEKIKTFLNLSVTDAKPVKLAEIAEEALEQSEIESHDFAVKCPKCKSTNVLRIEQIRRGGIKMLT
ncbi:MAG: transposase [Planctomycetota bacterium]|nr:transposase [Planctomycetota bacterium]